MTAAAVGALAVAAPAAAAGLEEIIVTARHRNERLADVSAPLSVLPGNLLTERRIRATPDLSSAVSNFEVGYPSGNAFPMFVIRGVGLNDYNTNNNPTVGVYQDDVYLSSSALIPRVLYDLDRVEVLKGPQGTLSGRNTTAGTVNFHSQGPGDSFAGYASLGYANYQTVEARAAAGGPIAEGAGLRVAGFLKRSFTGPQFNRVTGRHHGEVRTGGGRAVVTLAPGDTLTARLTLSGAKDNSDILQFQHRGVLGRNCQVATRGIFDPAVCFDALGYHDIDGDKLAGDYSRSPRMHNSDVGGVLRLDWQPTEDWTLVSVTGASHSRQINSKEEDSAPQVVVQGDFDSRIRQLSQELRLVSPTGQRIDWLVGAFAGRYRHREHRFVTTTDAERLLGPIFGSPLLELPYRQATNAGAGFADASVRLAPGLRVAGGVRYSLERIAYRGGVRLPLLGGVPITQLDDHFKTSKLSWRAHLSYTPLPGLLLYGQAATGFKSGGYFGGFAFTQAELRPYRPETVLSYEAGLRWRATTALSLGLAGFLYDYDDLQAVAPGTVGAAGTLTTPTLRNLPGVRVQGADLEARWQVDPEFSLSGTLGLLRTRVRGPAFSYGSVGAAGPLFDISGNNLPRAPWLSATLAADWRRPLSPSLELVAGAVVSYRVRAHMDLLNTPMATQPGFATVNARLGVEYGGWQMTLWGRNLTNEMPYLAGGPIGLGERDLVVYGPPRTWGIELRREF